MRVANRTDLICALGAAGRVQTPSVGGDEKRNSGVDRKNAGNLPVAERHGCGSGGKPFLAFTERQLVDIALDEVIGPIEIGRGVVPPLVDEEGESAVVVGLITEGLLPG